MGVCVLGGCAGRIFQTLPGLGPATQFGIGSRSGSVAYGPDASAPTAWTRPSFLSRAARCLPNLHHTTRTTRHSYQHEPIGNAPRQCPRGKFHEDSQIRGSLPHRIPRPRGSQAFDQAVSGNSLQPAALAFGAGLSSAAGVRTQLTTLASHGGKTSMSFLRHEEIYRSDVSPATAGSGNSWSPPQRSSAAMSFQSAIPWRVALRQSLPPLHRLATILNNPLCRTMIFQRTATTPLTSCLSPRVHSIAHPCSALTPNFAVPRPNGQGCAQCQSIPQV